MSVTATNRRVAEHEGGDFYPTPEWATQALIDAEELQYLVFEPACGDGAMATVLESAGHSVIASDLHNRGRGDTGVWFDFLHVNEPGYGRQPGVRFDLVTNPPYALAEEFLAKAMGLEGVGKICLLLRLAFLEGARRHASIFSIRPPTRVHVFSSRITMYPNGERTGGTGTTAYAWFVWDMQAKPGVTELRWIGPRK